MEQTSKIYIVKYNCCNEIDGVHAFFDSKEKAETFLNRFKTFRKDLEIVEIPLNPKYIVNKLADPYYVAVIGKATSGFDCEIYDYIDQAAAAEKEEYEMIQKQFFSLKTSVITD